MRNRATRWLGALIAVCLLVTSAAARQNDARRLTRGQLAPAGNGPERRVALVIGNDTYPRAPLKNAAADAVAMHAALTDVGFEVTQLLNIGMDPLERGVNAFIASLQPGDVALFYFSGHGMEIQGENYLLPIDFAADDEIQAKRRALSANEVVERMSGKGARVRMLVLDACRDNPYSARKTGAGGLAEMPTEGTLIAFATAPRQTASDNPGGRNGLFTTYLLEALREPGLSALEVFRRARQQVFVASNNRQRPWVSEDLLEDFYFRPGVGGGTRGGADDEILFWQSVERSNNASEFRAYLQRYPQGRFAPIAKARKYEIDRNPAPGDPASMSRWFTSEGYQQEFNRQMAVGKFATVTEGRNYEGESQYRAVFSTVPREVDWWECRHSLTQAEFQEKDRTLQSQGIRRIWMQQFTDATGVVRFQGTWVRSR